MTITALAQLSLKQLKRAVAVREKIESLERDLDLITGGHLSPVKSGGGRRRGKLSAAAKARISVAMKARWLKRKGLRRRISTSSRAAQAPRRLSARTNKTSSRGQLKSQITQMLKTAGKSGATVKDLAEKTGKSYVNISVWFHTTAKGVKEIKKVAPGRFAWAG